MVSWAGGPRREIPHSWEETIPCGSREFHNQLPGGSGSCGCRDFPPLLSSVWKWVPVGVLVCFFAFEMTGSHFLLHMLSEVVCLGMLHNGPSPSLSPVYLCLWTSLPDRMGDHIGFNRMNLSSTCLGGQSSARFSLTAGKPTKAFGIKMCSFAQRFRTWYPPSLWPQVHFGDGPSGQHNRDDDKGS